MTELLAKTNFISGLCDRSEARKTKEEKELVYVKLVKDGTPVCLYLKCNRMKDYGGTDAKAIQKSFLSAFDAYKIDITDKDAPKLISACADGASVNMGAKTGAMTTLKQIEKHLLIIHCGLHKLELAIQDAYQKSDGFLQVSEMMTSIYFLFKNNGKKLANDAVNCRKTRCIITSLPKSVWYSFPDLVTRKLY